LWIPDHGARPEQPGKDLLRAEMFEPCGQLKRFVGRKPHDTDRHRPDELIASDPWRVGQYVVALDSENAHAVFTLPEVGADRCRRVRDRRRSLAFYSGLDFHEKCAETSSRLYLGRVRLLQSF
jgi:hypothetical protein